MKKFIFAAMLMAAFPVQAKPYLDIHKIDTPKGLHVWFVQDKTIPVMALKISLKGGSQLDAQGKEGTAYLLSTLFDEGAGKRSSEAFQDALDENAIRMGFSATQDSFYGSLKTTMAHSDVAFELFDDALNRPHFDDEAIARMKQSLQSNLRFMHMDPNWMAQDALSKKVFAGSTYARENEGTEKSLEAVTKQDLQQEKAELFCRERLKISVVGDMNDKDVAAMADRFFGAWPSCATNMDETPIDLQAKGETITLPWQGAQSSVILVQQGMARQNKDWWAGRILDFALGGGEFSSRLMQEVRVKRGLTYGIFSSLAPYDRSPIWLIQAGIDPGKVSEAVNVTKKIWGEVAANGLKDEEIREAQDYLIGSLPLALTSTDKIAAILLQLQQDNLPSDTLDTRAAEINAVTSDDIRRVAKEYLKADNLTTVIVGPEAKGK